MIDDGSLGKIVNIQHIEPVGNVHQSHSFVRGNWGNSDRSSCMILQKSCHDTDIIQWLVGKECLKVQSFGSLSYFTPENAPEGAPERCIDGCPEAKQCPYNAVKLYYDDKKNGWFRKASTKKMEPTDEDVELALRTTEYGKCVFKCSNNVVDHQVVNMEFEDGITCSFTMCAFSSGGRYIRIMGTKGELCAEMGQPTMKFVDFVKRKTTEIQIADRVVDDTIVGGHGGGDGGIIAAFYDLLNGVKSNSIGDISDSVKSHMIAFAAEKSRLEGRVVEIKEMYE
jgi:predicted dehydrogenase